MTESLPQPKKQPIHIWIIINMEKPVKMSVEERQKLETRRKLNMAQTESEKVEHRAQLEILMQNLFLQNVESQSFAIKALTELFLSPEFTGNSETTRYHLQYLKLNRDFLEIIMQYKLGF